MFCRIISFINVDARRIRKMRKQMKLCISFLARHFSILFLNRIFLSTQEKNIHRNIKHVFELSFRYLKNDYVTGILSFNDTLLFRHLAKQNSPNQECVSPYRSMKAQGLINFSVLVQRIFQFFTQFPRNLDDHSKAISTAVFPKSTSS